MHPRQAKEQYLMLLKEKAQRIKYNKINQYFPSTGPLARDKYVKHMEFFRSGQDFRQRCIMAANRIGKSESIGAYELTLHLTGRYPDWWEGVRFTKPIKSWAAGTTGTTARDIVQSKLIGPVEDRGSGIIPKKFIKRTTPKAGGIPNAVDMIFVEHISGGLSVCKIKSYAEGRKSFEGTEQDFIWLDEECPMAIYTECITRTMTTKGHVILTFTPLEGITETVQQFLTDGKIDEQSSGFRKLVTATWDDAPHLSPEDRKELYDSLPPHQKEARSKGVPQLGSGAVYPIAEDDFLCDPMSIPDYWPRAYGMDVGWQRTAAIWGATDPATNITYIYGEYYRGEAEPIIHVAGIKAKGSWIPGVIDPASRGRSQLDGKKLFKQYRKLGLLIKPADNAVETGIHTVWTGLSTGQIKIFRSCRNTLAEIRLYRRNEKGQIVKENDHLMDALRYFVMSGIARAKMVPPAVMKKTLSNQKISYSPRDKIIGI